MILAAQSKVGLDLIPFILVVVKMNCIHNKLKSWVCVCTLWVSTFALTSFRMVKLLLFYYYFYGLMKKWQEKNQKFPI